MTSRPCAGEDDPADAGFSLIEMLVTLALIALLATVMIGAIVQMRSMLAISARNDVDTEFDALGNYLDRIIANAKLLSLIENNPERQLVFEGTPDHIRFVAVIRIGSEQLNLRDVELLSQPDGKSLNLVQKSSPRRLTNTSNGSATPASVPTLITDLQSISFEYLGVPTVANNTQSNWKSVWNEPGRLPRAVRITIKAERNRYPVRLERIINLKLAQ